MKKFFLIIFLFLLKANLAFAQNEGDLTASPSVIDDSVPPRGLLEYTVSLENHTDHKLSVFPLLVDLKEDGASISDNLLDRQFKMTKWISIKRGSIEIMPQSKITIPLKIDVPQDAIPGDYFSSITFSYGAHRAEAEERAHKMNLPKLVINLAVEDLSVEKLSILKFNPIKKVSTKTKPGINLSLNNSGTVDLIPKGNIFVYNKRSQEVDAIDINPDFKIVPAGGKLDLILETNKNLKTGKYKARLEADYGNKISRDLNDSTYLIVITLPFLLFFGFALLLFIILLTRLIFKKTYHHKPRADHPNIKKIPTRKEEGTINLKSK